MNFAEKLKQICGYTLSPPGQLKLRLWFFFQDIHIENHWQTLTVNRLGFFSTSFTEQVPPLYIDPTFCPHPWLFTAASAQLCWAANKPQSGGCVSEGNAGIIFPGLGIAWGQRLLNNYSWLHKYKMVLGWRKGNLGQHKEDLKSLFKKREWPIYRVTVSGAFSSQTN